MSSPMEVITTHQKDDRNMTGPEKREVRVLMLEDSDSDAELTERELCRGGVCYRAKRVMTREEFERGITEFKPSIVLADYSLPTYDGLSALAFVLERCPGIPFIFVSGTMGEEFAVEGLRKGATDYILKNHLVRLVPAMQRALQEAGERKEKQRAIEALHESERRYKRLIESVTDYIYTVYIKDNRPKMTTHGTGCVAVTGYTTEDYDRDPYLWYRMIHDEDRGAVTKQARDILAGKTTPLEHRIIHKNGTVRWVRNTPVPRYDDHKQLVSYDGLVVDITDRKNAEEALKRYQESLEEKVKERTKELEEARLSAESANRAKSDFLANMSHELRTPLNSILGFSEVLQDGLYGPINEKQKGYVNNIYSSGSHLLSLINDILDLSKVESGNLELDLAKVSLENVLHGAISMLKEKAMKHGITMALDIDPGAAGEIIIDERKLKQIMFNLLSNAVKFTLDGGSVRVSARLMKNEGRGTRDEKEKSSIVLTSEASDRPSSIVISVADTGIGIKPEDVDKLFKPFSQVESVYTRTFEGTGLGLALTRRLVEFLGGRIWAESKFGKGSVFTFVIPFTRENEQEGE